MTHDVFISYASKDGAEARGILEFLESRGIRCWIDKQELRFTGKYDSEIERAIRKSCVVIWLASQRSVESDYVKFEISTALNDKKRIGPVYLEPMDPARLPAPFNLKLANVQGIQLCAGPREENLEKLVNDLWPLIRSHRRRRPALAAGIVVVLAAVVALGLWIASAFREGPQEPVDVKPPAPERPESPAALDGWVTPPAKPLPSGVARLSAADILEVAYTGLPPAAPLQAERPTLQIEILARREGQTAFSRLKDGDTLASRKDDYFVALRPLSAGFLYVFQVDSTGKKEWLFPENETCSYSSGCNPVRPDEILQVPSAESDRVLFLDDTAGVEHIYTVFSATGWPDLEDALSGPVESPAPPPATGPGARLPVMTVRSPNGLLGRGVGGARVQTSTGQIAKSFLVQRTDRDQTCSLPISTQPLQASGRLLVIERWFKHVNPD